MDYLKSKPVEIPSIGKTLVLKELSHKAQVEFSKTYNNEETKEMAGAVMRKYGVVDWANKTVEEISAMLSMHQINEISTAITALSPQPKNSESTPTDDSSST